MKRKKPRAVGVILDEDIYVEIQEIARKEMRSMASTLRLLIFNAVQEYLRKEKAEKSVEVKGD